MGYQLQCALKVSSDCQQSQFTTDSLSLKKRRQRNAGSSLSVLFNDTVRYCQLLKLLNTSDDERK